MFNQRPWRDLQVQKAANEITGDMDIELPSSAVAILRVTYESLFFKQKLHYKDRRKVWKKYKRKKARIINHFAILKLQKDSSPHESNNPDHNEQSSDLPKGPLTNSAIIQHLKSLDSNKNTELVGILQNPIRAPKNIAHCEVDSATLVTGLEKQSNSPNGAVVSMETGTNIALNEDSARPANETDEITRLLAELDDDVERWQNPQPPANYQPPVKDNEINVGLSERQLVDVASSNVLDDSRPLCSFYSKTGACRFGIRCSKKHESIGSSDTLVFLNMFNTFLFDLEDRLRISGDAHDLSLEHSEQDLYKEFAEFYFEIQPEFHNIGRLSHLYVCRNRCHHLRGNVYVQYLSKSDAKACFDKMSGRYFGGKPLVCNYVNISSWAGTLCGIDMRTGKCSRGGQCNYLHVFRTPNSKKYSYSLSLNRDHSPCLGKEKADRESSNTSRLKSKSFERSPNTHDRSRKKDYKNSHRHSKYKRARSRSRSRSTGVESDTIRKRKRHKSSKISKDTFKNSSSDDQHSSAGSDENNHNSYQESKRRKKSKKKKKKLKKKDKHNEV